MKWQDCAFFAASTFFCLSLIPTIRDRAARIPRATSVPTAAFILLCAVTNASLHFYLAASMNLVASSLWAYIGVTKGAAR